MKKILLIIPFQLALIFPNILMMQINHNFPNKSTLNQSTNLNNTYDQNDQAMFNWENTSNNKISYGYYTNKDLIDLDKKKDTKTSTKIIDDHSFNYEIKIGITNKTSTYYTNKPFRQNDIEGSNYDKFENEFEFEYDIETISNYYGIGFELKIKNASATENRENYDYLESHSLYISQTYDKNDKIGNYQKALRKENYEDDYYFYYDNWSGMMQDDVYLNFYLVDTTSSSDTNDFTQYNNSKPIEPIKITQNEIYEKTRLEKNDVNTCNNSFGINYDDVEYHHYINKTHSSTEYGEDWKANDYTANFNVKWNAQTLFWKEYFYDWNNKLYFNAIYEIPITYDNKDINVVGFTNNGQEQVGRNYSHDENINIKPEQNLEINLELYSNPTDPEDYRANKIYPYILGYYNNDDEFIPITDKSKNLVQLDQDKIDDGDITNVKKPNEIHFILSNKKQENYQFLHNNLFVQNEEEMNETILNNLVNTNNENIYEYPYNEKFPGDNTSHFYDETYATGYQNAFLIPEWDNVNHPKTKGSFYYVNLVWLVISLIVGFVLLILILIPLASKREKQLEGRDKT